MTRRLAAAVLAGNLATVAVLAVLGGVWATIEQRRWRHELEVSA